MAVELDLADIQGNVLVAYGKLGFPKGRLMLFHIGNADSGREFVTQLLPMITTALRWKSRDNIPTGQMEVQRPEVAVNIAFTWYGLLALGIPTRTLRGMPDEFIDGMAARAPMLGDDFRDDWKSHWDEVWTKSARGDGPNEDRVHILITLNAQMDPLTGAAVPALDEITAKIERLAEENGIKLLAGHNRPGQPVRKYQELSALLALENGKYIPTPKEYFGFTDGISDPVFDGQYPNQYEQTIAKGSGALDGEGNWRPLATGEFLLGYPDEAQETPGAAMPLDFSRNGTFMAYRKLHQNVAAFRDFMDETAKAYAKVSGIDNHDDARETLMAKMAGRWSDGVPLALAKDVAAWRQFQSEHKASDPKTLQAALTEFSYHDDKDGLKCPMTAHVRRVNTRDMMGPTSADGSVLANRRRILRRGLPYGRLPDGTVESDEQGIIMLIVCASLFRQFEFVQQQWINYGLDSNAGSDSCPIVGNHSPGGAKGPKAKFVVPADPTSGRPPFIAEGLPQFVETRGGDYFFVPSMTALRMIGMGVVDPT